MTVEITLAAPPDPAELGAEWTALESRAAASFFQTWAWTGCRFAERFSHPLLLRARRAGETVALGLFNRRPRRLAGAVLHLGETGAEPFDALFIEHNGLLVARDHAALLPTLYRAARRSALGPARGLLPHVLVLPGLDARQERAARASGGLVRQVHTRPAPFVDLTRLRASRQDFAASLSANTRQQLGRSNRRYAARGPLAIARAATPAQAHDWLDALARLHQASWIARGKPGAFAHPFFARFHHELIDRAPDAVDLLRVSAADLPIGYLLNFRHRGHVYAYQSGFDYASADRHQKPGLTCHAQAIALYAAEGMEVYDFLAGADRYKRSLANAEAALTWLRLLPGPRELLPFARA